MIRTIELTIITCFLLFNSPGHIYEQQMDALVSDSIAFLIAGTAMSIFQFLFCVITVMCLNNSALSKVSIHTTVLVTEAIHLILHVILVDSVQQLSTIVDVQIKDSKGYIYTGISLVEKKLFLMTC